MDTVFIIAFSTLSLSISLLSTVIWAFRAANSLQPTDIAG